MICGDILAGGARRFDCRDDLRGQALHVRAQCFDVREMHGQVRFAPNAQDLFDRLQQADAVRRLVALMRVVDSAANGGLLRESDHFVRRREALGCVEQSGRETDRAFAHPFRDERAHAVELFGRRRARLLLQHARAHSREADVGHEVCADTATGERGAVLRYIWRTGAIDADQQGGRTLHQPRCVQPLSRIVGTDVGIRMRVGVDETRRHDPATRFYDSARLEMLCAFRSDVDDLVSRHHNIADECWSVGTRVDPAALYEHVCWRARRRRRSGRPIPGGDLRLRVGQHAIESRAIVNRSTQNHGTNRASGADVLQRIAIEQYQVRGLADTDRTVLVELIEPRRTRAHRCRQSLQRRQSFLDIERKLVVQSDAGIVERVQKACVRPRHDRHTGLLQDGQDGGDAMAIGCHRRCAIESRIESTVRLGAVDAARRKVRGNRGFVLDAGVECVVEMLDRAETGVDRLAHSERHRDVAGGPEAGRARLLHRIQEQLGLQRAVRDLHEVDAQCLEFLQRCIDVRLGSRFERSLPDRLDAFDLRSRAQQRRSEQRAVCNLAAPGEHLVGQIARRIADSGDSVRDVHRQQRPVLVDEIDSAAEVDVHVPQAGNQVAALRVDGLPALP